MQKTPTTNYLSYSTFPPYTLQIISFKFPPHTPQSVIQYILAKNCNFLSVGTMGGDLVCKKNISMVKSPIVVGFCCSPLEVKLWLMAHCLMAAISGCTRGSHTEYRYSSSVILILSLQELNSNKQHEYLSINIMYVIIPHHSYREGWIKLISSVLYLHAILEGRKDLISKLQTSHSSDVSLVYND